ncbi:MAG: peptidylprolyl isomerase [Candidatus Pseudobacter hemicellulosilyticus]|uniref:Peptidylprolyl isomerase n=1 Tax=Candidatus Pseudobacter hemicellulosilyticus TaxID=3121375 RepID=A0AAJ6BIQ2_9BACT|nr:MAG: peptidylprolyl isomerase [Pseudobacter sp.]
MTILRKLTTASVLTLAIGAGHAQTIFTYGKKPVSRDEFLKAFNKNNTEQQPSAGSYQDYLELYSRFKIKVQAALDQRLDTLPTQRAELASFRNQVVENYMNDEASLQVMITEALERSRKDLHIAHIFIPLTPDAAADKVQSAQDKINAASAALKSGEDFGQVALRYSEDPAVSSNKGDLGFLTVFILPYELENIVYNTPAGQVSTAFRSPVGYHLFKNLGERKALGKIKVAQILLGFPPEATSAQEQAQARLADSLYKVLGQGGDFKALAAQYSADNLTYHSGGEMLDFGVGQYEKAFEEAAFGLPEDGAISKPVRSSFGYHIIKRLQRLPVPEGADNSYREEIRFLVQRSDRMAVARKVLYKKILELTGYKTYTVDLEALGHYADSVLRQEYSAGQSMPDPQTPLFSFSGQVFRVPDFRTFLQTTVRVEPKNARGPQQLLDAFTERAAFDYYRNHLETYNTEFASQLHEFQEGNLLFEIMQRNVWEKAAADSTGLAKFYAANSSKYWWEASADAIIFTAASQELAEATRTRIAADPSQWRNLVEAANGALQADSGRFELGQIPVLERTNFTPGLITANVKNDTDNSLLFAYIYKVYSDRQPRIFADARGFVINDYQQELEEKWIAELKKKYPIKINQKVLKGLPQ